MRVLVAPLMAMAESAGPATRARALASAMASRGWKTTLCVPEGFRGTVPADVSPQPIRTPSPLGMPRTIGRKMFPLAQKLGLNRRVPITCFDDVLKLTGNTNRRYLTRAVEQLRKIIQNGRFDAVYSAAIQQVFVELLQVQRSEICQRDAADLRLDVVFQKALRGFEGRWAQLDFCVVLHPDLQPCSYGVGFGPPIVDAHIFLDGFLQLFLNLRLRLAEDIFDDGLASFEIVTNCVPAFPSSILAFSDIAFAVCSSFWHKISLLCNGKGYRNQGSKATRKSNCYQKVIICPSEPRRLIFAYGGAISALPGAFSLVTAVQFSNG